MTEEYSDSRRRFLGYVIGGISGAIALGYAVPLATYLVKPSLGRQEEQWSEVGRVDELTVDEPVELNFYTRVKEGWKENKVEHGVWVVKKADGSVTAFSPTCPHLGCGYRWNQSASRFECPCHASVFDIDGKVSGGPAPRDLDTLPSRVEDGKLYVIFKKYRLGVKDRVEA